MLLMMKRPKFTHGALALALIVSLCSALLTSETRYPLRHPMALHMVDPWNDKLGPVPIVQEEIDPVNGETTSPMRVQVGESVQISSKPSKSPVEQSRKRNLIVAALAIALAVGQYVWQLAHPVTPVSLLVQMTRESSAPQIIGRNDKPTVVDFWAPWCENCQVMAPTIRALHDEYEDRVNFVTINADAKDMDPWPYINTFGVDAIPHIALVSAQGDVETALIGLAPKSVLAADLDVLLQTSGLDCPPNIVEESSEESKLCSDRPRLPYTMLDVFKQRPNDRRVRFD